MIKLPTTGMKLHPFLVILSGRTLTEVARALEVRPQTIYSWKTDCLLDRNFLLPAERVPQLSKLSGIAPFYFRPDLWPTIDWTFK